MPADKGRNGLSMDFLPEKMEEKNCYTELQVTTNFSFLRGGSHPEELVTRAAELGYKAIAITDRNTLAGVVRAHVAARGKGIRTITACRLDLLDGPSLLAYPTDVKAYGCLSHLLTQGNLRMEKGKCGLYKEDVYQYAEGMLFIIVPPDELNERFDFDDAFKDAVGEYRRRLGENVYLGACFSYRGNDAKKLFRLSRLAVQYGAPMVAVNDVHYHEPGRRELQDILTCTREKCTIYNAGFRLYQNAERYLKTESEMLRLFRRYPDAIARTQEIANACTFSLDELKYIYPDEKSADGCTPQQQLTDLAWKHAYEIFGDPLPEKIKSSIEHELRLIDEMNYANYFLTVYHIVRTAKKLNILCQGRGSAANSTVCFVLGITVVNPEKFDLLFERFISSARDEPPDIDVDFEHERREEIMQHIYEKYGRDHAAIVATVTQVHYKGAVRDVAKAMGLSQDMTDVLAGCHGIDAEGIHEDRLREAGLNSNDPHLRKVLELTQQYIGFPRQLGQHTGGFVITQNKLADLCPILNARMEGRTCIEWNKDDIDALGILKIDILALGMLTCIRKCFDLAGRYYGLNLTLGNIPQDDPAVYEMISHADTIGVFQIESRAQMSMLPRLKPNCFYDLVIEVAIVRPGPIQGDMVHPYLRRRNGEEPVEYPSEGLKEILGKTLGVPLFQEQAMKIAIVAAGFTASEADELRKSMATFRAKGIVSRLEEKLINGMIKNGYTEAYARRVFKQLEGFGSYGFPQSHAASFAILVYISAWIKCYHPDIFAAGMLNSQPLGFYAPAQIVSDAKKHGVTVKPADVNLSEWDNILEEINGRYKTIRLGFRQIKGLKQEEMDTFVSKRKSLLTEVHQLRDLGVSLGALERLADADAFLSMGLDRRRALWEVSALGDRPTGIFEGQLSESASEPEIKLPEMTASEHVFQDYSSTGLSLKAHPVSLLRSRLLSRHILTAKDLNTAPNGAFVKVAGLVLVRQRPMTASGICFITIEDETGSVNLVVFRQIFEKYRREILQAKLLMAEGKLQREGEVIHIAVRACHDLSGMFSDLMLPEPAAATPIHHAEAKDTLPPTERDNRKTAPKLVQGTLFPSRNFK